MADSIKNEHIVWAYGGQDGTSVLVLGGNQGDAVSLARFSQSMVIGVRRLRG